METKALVVEPSILDERKEQKDDKKTNSRVAGSPCGSRGLFGQALAPAAPVRALAD